MPKIPKPQQLCQLLSGWVDETIEKQNQNISRLTYKSKFELHKPAFQFKKRIHVGQSYDNLPNLQKKVPSCPLGFKYGVHNKMQFSTFRQWGSVSLVHIMCSSKNSNREQDEIYSKEKGRQKVQLHAFIPITI